MNALAQQSTRERIAAYASKPQAEMALFSVAAMEGAFMPVSADDLLVPMSLLNPDRAFVYGLIATFGSVCGALAGFIAGALVFRLIGLDVFGRYGALPSFLFLQSLFVGYVAIVVISAGFSAIPYKIATFFAGFFGASIPVFVLACAISRGMRYGLMALLVWRGGMRYSQWLERNFYSLTLVLTLSLLLLFALVVFLVKTS
jgi:membrane protein YqaA with SNARE-associated domain